MHPRAVPIALILLLAAVPALPGTARADDRGFIHRSGAFIHHGDGVSRQARQAPRHDTRHESGQGTRRDTRQETRHDGVHRAETRHERHRRDDRVEHRVHVRTEHRRDLGVRPDARHHGPVRHARHTYHAPGYRFTALPRTHLRLVVGNSVFYYFDGVYVTPRWGAYVVVGAPVGAHVRYLPAGYVSFFLGPRRFFHVNATYYLWDDWRDDYVVVEKPRGADEALAAADGYGDELFVYPAEGQSDARRDQDRYACHEWALTEAGREAYRAPVDSDDHDDYLRALGACLQARGYAVR